MAKGDFVKNAKSVGEIIGVGSVVLGLAGGVYTFIKTVLDDRKDLIKIPNIKRKKGFILVDDYVRTLKEIGLKPKLSIAKPQPKFKNFSDGEISFTDPRPYKKVSPGSIITVYYVNNKVIEKSKKLYEKEKKTKKKP